MWPRKAHVFQNHSSLSMDLNRSLEVMSKSPPTNLDMYKSFKDQNGWHFIYCYTAFLQALETPFLILFNACLEPFLVWSKFSSLSPASQITQKMGIYSDNKDNHQQSRTGFDTLCKDERALWWITFWCECSIIFNISTAISRPFRRHCNDAAFNLLLRSFTWSLKRFHMTKPDKMRTKSN